METNSVIGTWAFEEDLSDMIAQESRKRQKRDEEKRGEKKERAYKF
jgi:splicing factor 3B subunit 2